MSHLCIIPSRDTVEYLNIWRVKTYTLYFLLAKKSTHRHFGVNRRAYLKPNLADVAAQMRTVLPQSNTHRVSLSQPGDRATLPGSTDIYGVSFKCIYCIYVYIIKYHIYIYIYIYTCYIYIYYIILYNVCIHIITLSYSICICYCNCDQCHICFFLSGLSALNFVDSMRLRSLLASIQRFTKSSKMGWLALEKCYMVHFDNSKRPYQEGNAQIPWLVLVVFTNVSDLL